LLKKGCRKLPAGGLGPVLSLPKEYPPASKFPQEWGIQGADEDFFGALLTRNKKRHILSSTEFIGIVAGACTTLGFIPQVIRVFLLKSTREISLPFTLTFLTGISLWLVYGILADLAPVIFWNAASAFLGTLLLYAKLKYG